MKTKKMVWMVGLVVISVLVFWSLGFVQAWGPVGFIGRGSHPKFHGMGFHSMDNKHLPEQILTVLDFKIGGLGLSEVQKEKYAVLRAELKTRLTKGLADRKALIEDLQTRINRPEPDIRAAAELIKNRMKDISGFMEQNIDGFVRFYDILDENQKSQVIENLRGHFEKR